MKTYFLLLLIGYSTSLLSQNLTISNIDMLLNEKDWEEVDNFLEKKGWKFYNSKDGLFENIIQWAYNRDDYTNKAQGWINLYVKGDENGKIEYTMANQKQFEIIENGIKTLKFEKIESEILDNGIIIKYSSKSLTVSLIKFRVETYNSYSNKYDYNYTAEVIKKFGPYDELNGSKFIELDNGYVWAEVVDGDLNGESRQYNDNNQIVKITNYVNGKLSGITTEFFYNKNDSLIAEQFQEYTDGKRNGKSQLFIYQNDEKKLVKEEIYKDDLRSGQFKQVKDDTLKIGNYKNGLLHGGYKEYRDLKAYILGGLSTLDMNNKILITKGQYSQGEKQNEWEYYFSNSLIKSGSFKNGEKDGVWKYYYPKITNALTEKEYEYSEQLRAIKTYRNDELNGKSIIFSHIDEEKYLCDNPEKNDTCISHKWIKEKQVSNYEDGVINGPYFLIDSKDDTLIKGHYNYGHIDGLWYYKNNEEVKKGSMSLGKKNGLWTTSDLKGNLRSKLIYSNGKLNGEQLLYENGDVFVTFYCNNGIPNAFSYFDGDNIIYKGEILELNYATQITVDNNMIKKHRLRLDYENDSSLLKVNYSFKSNNDIINFYELRNKILIESLAPESNHLVKEGEFKIYNNDKLVKSGNFISDKRQGPWTSHYHEQNLKKIEQFKNDTVSSTKIVTVDYDLYDGAFEDTDENLKIIYKVKDGLYHGKAKVYNLETKELIEKKKYKHGVLK